MADGPYTSEFEPDAGGFIGGNATLDGVVQMATLALEAKE